MRLRKNAGCLPAILLLTIISAVRASTQEKIDLETVSRIRYEGFRDSKVMELATGLMDSIGQRLTGSPNMKRANEWTRDQLTSFGLVCIPQGLDPRHQWRDHR
jgi:carboxypeptidase Q